LIQGFLLEASLSQGDLSEADWRILRGLLPIDAVNRGRGRPPEENRSTLADQVGACTAALMPASSTCHHLAHRKRAFGISV
jgi:hypothetical protein